MNSHPGGGQYNYNPAAYAQASAQAQQRQSASTHQNQQSAQPQPQRQTTTTATNRNAAAAISNASKIPPVGRYVSSSLSILGSMNEQKSKKRSVHDLDRLLYPLMVCTANSNNDDGDDDEEDSNDEDIVSNKKRKEDKNNEQKHAAAVHHFYHYKKSTSEKKDGTITPTTKYEYQQLLQTELEQYKQQNKQLMERRLNVFKSLVSLHEMYETGLDCIARMNDLSFCPDNVMPDNIPK